MSAATAAPDAGDVFDDVTPLGRELTITKFTSAIATAKREHRVSLRDLAPRIRERSGPTKDKLPWLKLATFGDARTDKGSLRHDANVLTVEGVEADYDGGIVSVDDAVRLLTAAGIAAMIYTSPSHAPAAPRWRVLAPFSGPLAPDARAGHCARLNGALGGILAGESFTLSQAYFYGAVAGNPAHRVELVEGRFLDDADDLEAGAIGKGGPPSKRAAPPAGNVVPFTRDPSRSGRAARLARATKAKGGSRADFDAALAADPELADWAADDRQVARTWGRIGADLDGFALTEDGIALAFAHRYGDRLRYCHDAGRWYEWTGAIWRPERTKLAFAWARDTCRELVGDGPADESKSLAKASTAGGVERLAQADRAFAVTADTWDRDTMLLGTPGGTVDLRTGELRAAVQGEFLTKATAVVPAADVTCPTWLRFLSDATGADGELIRFLQQWFGYSLTGQTTEHALLFIYGPGGNGKSVFLNTLAGILGDYATNAAMDSFTASRFDKHTTDLAMLRGARLVMASETEEGRAWAEARIKAITGGDPITARLMRQDNFTYLPQFKLTIVGNHKPPLHNVDDAMKRRFNIVPFERRPAHPDPDLEAKLRAEWPGILAWAIRGCLDWQAHRLVRPPVVREATAEYFAAQDTFQQWLDDCCEVGRAHAETTAELWASWDAFASLRGERAQGKTKGFPDRLAARGFKRIKNECGIRGRGFAGVRVCQHGLEASGDGI